MKLNTIQIKNIDWRTTPITKLNTKIIEIIDVQEPKEVRSAPIMQNGNPNGFLYDMDDHLEDKEGYENEFRFVDTEKVKYIARAHEISGDWFVTLIRVLEDGENENICY